MLIVVSRMHIEENWRLTMLRVCMMHACVVFSTWINSSQSSWSNPLTSDRILIGDRAASLSVDLPLSGDGINSCPSSSSSSARSSQSVALISCHRFRKSIPLSEIIADGKLINEGICIGIIYPCKKLCMVMTGNCSNVTCCCGCSLVN